MLIMIITTIIHIHTQVATDGLTTTAVEFTIAVGCAMANICALPSAVGSFKTARVTPLSSYAVRVQS